MKTFLTTIIIILAAIPANAQWKKISTPTTEDLYDIQVSGATGYSAGQNSTVLKTTDSGKSWKKLSLGLLSNLRALYFIDSLTGMVTGENARIMKTIDGGKTWAQKYARIAAYANAITFSGSNGITIGRNMLAVRSSDFGESWQVDTTLNSDKMLNSVCISPDGTCWAVGDSGFILNKHVSRGKWNIGRYPTNINLNSVSCIGDSVILIAGGMPDSVQIGVHYNIFLRSTDKGNTWSTTGLSEMKTVRTAWFRTKDTGFFAGSNGIISRSYEPFTERSQQKSGSASILNRIMFDGKTGFIAGDGGTILRTTNNGGFGLSVVNVSSFSSTQAYPNPSINGAFRITGTRPLRSLAIYNSLGQIVIQKNNPGITEEIHLDNKGLFTAVMTYMDGGNTCLSLVNE